MLGHDLVTQCVFNHFPPDHPLRWQLTDFDAAEMSPRRELALVAAA